MKTGDNGLHMPATCFGLASLMLLSTVARSQAPLPELRIDAITAGSVLFVRNTSQQPLVAYLIELVDYPGSSYSLWQDEIASGEFIAPGVEKRIQITNMTVGAVPDYVKMRAAIYADGSTAGIPEKVALMTGRRRAQLDIARELRKRIEAGDEILNWADSLKPEGKPNYSSAAWVNRTAQYSFVQSFRRKTPASVADVLAQVRAAEMMLAASKPAL